MSKDDTIQPFDPATDYNLVGSPHLPYSPEERLHRFNALAVNAINAAIQEQQQHGFGTIHPTAMDKVQLNTIADLAEFDQFFAWWQSANTTPDAMVPTLAYLALRAPAGYTLKEAFVEAAELLQANTPVTQAQEQDAEEKRRAYMREYMRDRRAAEKEAKGTDDNNGAPAPATSANDAIPRAAVPEGYTAALKAMRERQSATIAGLTEQVSEAHSLMMTLAKQKKEMLALHKAELDNLAASYGVN